MNDIAIKIDNISKVYKLYPSNRHRLKEALDPLRRKYHTEFYALKSLNLIIKKSEIIGIVGRNGAGKSTLLKIISGVTQPTRGHLDVNGNISALLELGPGFNPEFTGVENIFFYGAIMGFSKSEMEDRLDHIVSFADIGDFVSKPMKIYSKGMRARLAFAVAINVDPDILIVDEVLAVGDELFQRKCYAKIENFMNKGVSILFVTHNVDIINQLCTRAILIDKGELILEGPAKLVTTQYQRLLYSNLDHTVKVREEIVRINQDDALKKGSQTESQLNKRPKIEENEKEIFEKIKPITNEPIIQKAHYIEQLKPESTVEYKNYDVEILDVKITTMNGRRVNVLLMGDKYIYSYKVKFNIEAKNVIFGMKIKDQKGLNITGMSNYNFKKLSPDKLIKKVKVGEKYYIKFIFRCLLLNGIYFTNAGVSTYTGNGIIFLNRITDAACFKVLVSDDCQSTGIIQMDQELTFEKLKPGIVELD